MIITFSKNPFIKFRVWFYNNIIYSFKNYYYKHKKTHYQCCVCGEIVAPYFEESEEEQYNVLTDDYGWHRLDNGKYNRWICHHCADHGYAWSNDTSELPDREYKWEEWEEIVKKNNERILNKIKEKDLDYYNYWFNYEDLED